MFIDYIDECMVRCALIFESYNENHFKNFLI